VINGQLTPRDAWRNRVPIPALLAAAIASNHGDTAARLVFPPGFAVVMAL
jgi:hypothetical protein